MSMKRIIPILFLVAVWALGGSALAIDRTRQSDSLKARNERRGYTPDKDSMKRTDEKQDRDRKDYDDFVDRNNNGIDDRAEQSPDQNQQENPSPADSTGANRDNNNTPPPDSTSASKQKGR